MQIWIKMIEYDFDGVGFVGVLVETEADSAEGADA